jgi:hypothetical protein
MAADKPPLLYLLIPSDDDINQSRPAAVVVKGVVAFVSFAKPLLSIPESLDLCSFWCD